jgi:hypothetical protein
LCLGILNANDDDDDDDDDYDYDDDDYGGGGGGGGDDDDDDNNNNNNTMQLQPELPRTDFAHSSGCLFVCLFSWRYNPLWLYFPQPGSGL